MRQLTDQMGRCVWVPNEPKRIISLVPSQTELLYDLGLGDELVGLTKFCVHPKGIKKEKTIIGGTKTYKLDVVRSLRPDLIIGNKEENDQVSVEELSKEFPVWMSDISNLTEALCMMEQIGELVGKQAEAQRAVERVKNSFDTLDAPKNEKVVYLIWHEPIMVAGRDTFINDMLLRCGFDNLILKSRYPVLTPEELQLLNPDRLLLSSEPFPFKPKHIKGYKEILPQSKIELVDGEMFSWYGTRLLKAVEYFKGKKIGETPAVPPSK